MDNKYLVYALHVEEGVTVSYTTDSIIVALFYVWKLRRNKYFRVVCLEIH